MPITVKVLFSKPQHEIATLIRNHLDQCQSIWIVSGFATVEGLNAVFPQLSMNIGKLQRLVVGAGTYRAFEMMDKLIDVGLPADHLLVHLGHSRSTGPGAKHSFYRYHPMLHSKIYYMENGDGTASVFIGSHNLTGFAMHGLNGEVGVLLEGSVSSVEMVSVRDHINECITQSIEYSSHLKDSYAWWSLQFVEGLRDKVNDVPRDGGAERTIIVLGVVTEGPLPKKNDIIYFEIPSALGQIQSLQADVHIYIFDRKPSSATSALTQLDRASASLWCRTFGLEKEAGGVELVADWQVISNKDPRLRRVTPPFRPQTTPGMQQVRVKVFNKVYERYEYLFSELKPRWEPEFNKEMVIQVSSEEVSNLMKLDIVPREDQEWYLVTGLKAAAGTESAPLKEAMLIASPESGAFILFSNRRRKKNEK